VFLRVFKRAIHNFATGMSVFVPLFFLFYGFGGLRATLYLVLIPSVAGALIGSWRTRYDGKLSIRPE
jgi:hypothetical protein